MSITRFLLRGKHRMIVESTRLLLLLIENTLILRYHMILYDNKSVKIIYL